MKPSTNVIDMHQRVLSNNQLLLPQRTVQQVQPPQPLPLSPAWQPQGASGTTMPPPSMPSPCAMPTTSNRGMSLVSDASGCYFPTNAVQPGYVLDHTGVFSGATNVTHDVQQQWQEPSTVVHEEAPIGYPIPQHTAPFPASTTWCAYQPGGSAIPMYPQEATGTVPDHHPAGALTHTSLTCSSDAVTAGTFGNPPDNAKAGSQPVMLQSQEAGQHLTLPPAKICGVTLSSTPDPAVEQAPAAHATTQSTPVDVTTRQTTTQQSTPSKAIPQSAEGSLKPQSDENGPSTPTYTEGGADGTATVDADAMLNDAPKSLASPAVSCVNRTSGVPSLNYDLPIGEKDADFNAPDQTSPSFLEEDADFNPTAEVEQAEFIAANGGSYRLEVHVVGENKAAGFLDLDEKWQQATLAHVRGGVVGRMKLPRQYRFVVRGTNIEVAEEDATLAVDCLPVIFVRKIDSMPPPTTSIVVKDRKDQHTTPRASSLHVVSVSPTRMPLIPLLMAVSPSDSPALTNDDSTGSAAEKATSATPTSSEEKDAVPTPNHTEAILLSPTDASTPNTTDAPSLSPIDAATQNPTDAPALSPTDAPSPSSTEAPTMSPIGVLTPNPPEAPTLSLTFAPTPDPTETPALSPADAPMPNPPDAPTPNLTDAPTLIETAVPTPPDSPTSADANESFTQTEVSIDTLAPTPIDTRSPTSIASDEKSGELNVQGFPPPSSGHRPPNVGGAAAAALGALWSVFRAGTARKANLGHSSAGDVGDGPEMEPPRSTISRATDRTGWTIDAIRDALPSLSVRDGDESENA